MTKTTNYNLNQWEESDRVTREDFNADNAAIDAALAEKPSLAFGMFFGDGKTPRDINLGYRPTAVLVTDRNGSVVRDNGAAPSYCGGFATPSGYGTAATPFGNTTVTITDTGFRVFYYTNETYNYTVATNANGEFRYYMVLR